MYKLKLMIPWIILAGMKSLSGLAQVPVHESDTLAPMRPDSLSQLHRYVQRGNFRGHARSYWMGTDNDKGFNDTYAWGIGVGLGYQTPLIARHFTLGLSGFFIVNVLSSDLSLPDPKTGQANRYEIGLFNIQDPREREGLNRLEELYLSYHFGKKSTLTVGRQIPHTPFINPQDGRMRPTLTEGVSLEWRVLSTMLLQAEFISRIAPRSTVDWFDVGESIGLYPAGVNVWGAPSQYGGNTLTSGIVQVGVSRSFHRVHIQVWNTYVPNVFNTAYVKAEFHKQSPDTSQWYGGIQAGWQQGVGQGGNSDPGKAYFHSMDKSFFISGQIGYKTPRWAIDLNATRITAKGRYLMPREWGRDPFYTFLPRERNEGMGDVSAGSLNLHYSPSPQWKWEVGSGVYHLPNPTNFRLNKYGMPGYAQLNIGMKHTFQGVLKGLDAQMLAVRKEPLKGSQLKNDKFIFNKVRMTHFDFILNYHF